MMFSIYRQPSPDQKRKEEADDIWWFLESLGKLTTIDDVEYGPDSPDFVFWLSGNSIGVELTKLNPKIFRPGGYRLREGFKLWEKEFRENPQPRSEFEWGEFAVKESLEAFEEQFLRKCGNVSKWKRVFQEKWLLVHVDSGSPFTEIFPARLISVQGGEEVFDDFRAKLIYALANILKKPHPFNYVVLFSGPSLFPFPANGNNPHKLPMAKPQVLKRGAKASDEFLLWRGSLRTVKKRGEPNGF